MGFFDVFKRKRHKFTDEERQKSRVSRIERDIMQDRIDYLERKRNRLAAEYRAREMEEEIAEMEEGLEDDVEEGDDLGANGPDALITQLLMRAMNQGPMKKPEQFTGKQSLTDEQLRAFKEKAPPEYLKAAQKMSDDEIMEYVKTNKPDIFETYDDDTIRRALIILKEKD